MIRWILRTGCNIIIHRFGSGTGRKPRAFIFQCFVLIFRRGALVQLKAEMQANFNEMLPRLCKQRTNIHGCCRTWATKNQSHAIKLNSMLLCRVPNPVYCFNKLQDIHQYISKKTGSMHLKGGTLLPISILLQRRSAQTLLQQKTIHIFFNILNCINSFRKKKIIF